MCGIAVILKSESDSCPASVLDRMRDEVAYRGPDDQGHAFFRRCRRPATMLSPSDSGWDVGLAHCRLSIIDLNQTGHQPMVYRDRFWIVYNGEVYNYIELRQELRTLGHQFHSNSDTEVVLAAYAEWGPAAFARFRGMWGLVICDTLERSLILSRDRLGIKPLYYWPGSDMLAAASEIKQLLAIPRFTASLDPEVAGEYLRTGYQDSQASFFSGVHPVPPGTWLRIPIESRKVPAPERYWKPESIRPLVTDEREAGERFAVRLRDAVRLCLRSDVPVGCTLSGGLDSSSIAVLASEARSDHGGRLDTFTITFPGVEMDERVHADAVLRQLSAVPHFVTPSATDFLEDMDRFVYIHDEPVGSLWSYAGYCVARLASRASVRVILNGQGGDEILSGYWQSYLVFLANLARRGQLWTLAQHLVGSLFPDGNPDLIGQIPIMMRRFRKRTALRSTMRVSLPGYPGAAARRYVSLPPDERRVYEIREMFLPRLLTRDDRNSMAFSVEGRLPFLDHEVIEECRGFDFKALFRRGWTKRPLRVGLSASLPTEIVRRRSKIGFGVPENDWFAHRLRPVLEDWLRSDGPVWRYLNRADARGVAASLWRSTRRPVEDRQALLRAFMFDRWCRAFSVG